MPTAIDVVSLMKSLTPDEQSKALAMLMNASLSTNDFEQIISDERFASGLVCPECGCLERIVRNGKIRNGKMSYGKQRYLCKDCGHSFIANSKSITCGTRKNYDVWQKYVDCMMQGLSIRETAFVCSIHRNTAFVWRHKILDMLGEVHSNVQLEGIVEADETFFRVSYKGNHTKSAFVMPRKAKYRGEGAALRGVSKEQVCVPCAIDRNGHSVSKVAVLGRITIAALHLMFDKSIKIDAVLCTDKMNAYVKFAKDKGIDLYQIESGKHKKGIYHIQHINSYHSRLKKFMCEFNGVSTKYLNNYLVWNNWINTKQRSVEDKSREMLWIVASALTQSPMRYQDISKREAIPILS